MYNEDDYKAPAPIEPEAPTGDQLTSQPEPTVTAQPYQQPQVVSSVNMNPSTSTVPNQASNTTADTTQTTPTGTEANTSAGYEEKKAPPQKVYYEPWQQPVYANQARPTQTPYTPGMPYNGMNNHGRPPVMEPPIIPGPKKKRDLKWVKIACLVLVCALVSGLSTYGVIQYSVSSGLLKSSNQVVLGANQTNGTSNQDSGTTQTSSPAGGTKSSEEIYEMATTQVVGVNSQGMSTNVFGQQSPSAVSGSGFIVSDKGYIVTNYHVIQYAAEQNFELTVMLHDGTSYPAKVIGFEKDNDLAVIKIDATGLKPVSLGTNKNMKVGDAIYAVGNPLGELDYSMTGGIVSALDRVIQVDETTSINMFQIDAAVNSGNSGGPVYNARGEVIGIVSAKYASTGVEGLGFAIPIDDAMDIVQQIISTGRVSGKPSMGVSVRTVTKETAENYNLREGAYVQGVTAGSAADKAGIKVGDIVIKLGDMEVTSADTLKLAKKNYKAGDTADIVVYREGKEVPLKITFDEEGVTATAAQPQQTPSIQTLPNQNAG